MTARVLLLSDGETSVAVVAYDLLGVPDGLAAGSRPASGRRGPRRALRDAHPCGPSDLRPAIPCGGGRAVAETLAEKTVALIEDARGRLRAAPFGTRALRCRASPTIAAYRRARPTLSSMSSSSGARTAALAGLWLSFACHPVVLGPQNLRYSADFPGVARRLLEERFDAPVLYTTGCCGQINTGHSALDSIVLKGMSRRTPEEAARIGRVVADAVTASFAEGEPSPRIDAAPIAYAHARFAAEFEPVSDERRRAIAEAARLALDDPRVFPSSIRSQPWTWHGSRAGPRG